MTLENAVSWGYAGDNIWLFRDGAVVVCADTGRTPEGELLEDIPHNTVRSVYADESVTEIDYNMFWGCANLTSVEMPNVAVIDQCAFSGCESLDEQTREKILQIGGDAAFY